MYSIHSLTVLLVVYLGLTFVTAAPVNSPLEAEANLKKRVPLCTDEQYQALQNSVTSESWLHLSPGTILTQETEAKANIEQASL